MITATGAAGTIPVGARFIAPYAPPHDGFPDTCGTIGTAATTTTPVGAQFIAPHSPHDAGTAAVSGTIGATPVGAQFIAPNSASHAAPHAGPPDTDPMDITDTVGAMNRAPTVGEMVRFYEAYDPEHPPPSRRTR